MREYELTVVYLSEEAEYAKGKQLFAEQVKKAGAEIIKEDDLGVKRLAYLINKQDQGHYIYYELKLDPSKVVDLEKSFQLSDEILKFLFVKKEQ